MRRLPLIFLLVACGNAVALAVPPSVTGFFPPGCQRGQSVVVATAGKFERWPVQAWSSDPSLAIEVGTEKGQVRITADPQSLPGVRWIRLFDGEGASTPRPVIVGSIPEIVESNPNDRLDRAQSIENLPITINGKIDKTEQVDHYSLDLEQDQTLVVAVEANAKLGSPMDAVLQIVTPDGFVLEQNDDAGSLDPRIAFRVPQPGRYVVRVFAFPAAPDSSIRLAGASNFVYRLTMTTGPYVSHVLPLAAAAEGSSEPSTTVIAHGWNLDDQTSLATPRLAINVLSASNDPEPMAVAFEPSWANAVEIPLVFHPVLPMERPTDAVLTPAITVSGVLLEPGQRDRHRFVAKKGDRLEIAVTAHRLGLPLDAVLELVNAEQKVIKRVDDIGGVRGDPRIDWIAPTDGEFSVDVADLHRRGSPWMAYSLSISPLTPDYRLSTAADSVVVEAQKSAEIVVDIARRDGFAHNVELGIEGLPVGAMAAVVVSEAKGDTSKQVKITISAGSEVFSGPIRIVGRCPEANDHPPRFATLQAAPRLADFWLTIKPTAK